VGYLFAVKNWPSIYADLFSFEFFESVFSTLNISRGDKTLIFGGGK